MPLEGVIYCYQRLQFLSYTLGALCAQIDCMYLAKRRIIFLLIRSFNLNFSADKLRRRCKTHKHLGRDAARRKQAESVGGARRTLSLTGITIRRVFERAAHDELIPHPHTLAAFII